MGSFKVRMPAVAGQFYPSTPKKLSALISGFIDKDAKRLDAIACVMPHAGYVYSGAVAAAVVSRLKVKDRIIILGPNHTGAGAAFSIMPKGIWQTPLGEVPVDEELAAGIMRNCGFLADNDLAHLDEHSLEVEIPFFQYFNKDFQIVPIVIGSHNPGYLKQLGLGIAAAVKEADLKDSVLIVASSDMTHYEPQEKAEAKDKQAIQAILELDEDKLTRAVVELDISMCGYAPVAAMIRCAKELGAGKAELVKYETSGKVSGDTTSVVGYAGIIIY
ncbi:MAG: AmmeMemoRadiSam system protein B [Candidatus Omnitrophica bacterium]|nr:AmmeMemoRadiSam system protein B [Candidatus Omnitrophota bacterium]